MAEHMITEDQGVRIPVLLGVGARSSPREESFHNLRMPCDPEDIRKL